PSIQLNTACSTSLAALDLANRALLSSECHMALAGGVSITTGPKAGYMYKEHMIFSPDGHCRAFDEQAQGTVKGEGAGIVVLKMLEDAIEDRDTIHAVIKGTAINNDGSRKVGFAAPSIEGEIEAINAALLMAEVEPHTIGYVEAHGTGTPLGDPIEIEALKVAYGTEIEKKCPIGSVKTNIGHLDQAAGIAGLIKTILALKHKQIPPSLHYKKPNPKIEIENTPFIVNHELTQWKRDKTPLRAGVSSFGMGGTNAHVILEEWPRETASAQTAENHENKRNRLIPLSAKTGTTLEKIAANMAQYLKRNPGANLADIAYTLQEGRKTLPHRGITVCSDTGEAIEALENQRPAAFTRNRTKDLKPPVVFMFPGLGAQYVNMGQGLYREYPRIREEMDRCFKILQNLGEPGFKEKLYPPAENHRETPDPMEQIDNAQIAVFILQYSLAKYLEKLGITPYAVIGYSFGEYTAAAIAGVFTLEEALKIVVTRGRLLKEQPGGIMMSVPLPAKELESMLTPGVTIAVDNGPSCIAAGPHPEMETFQQEMKEKKYLCMRIPTTHALHTEMMTPLLKEFETALADIKMKTPQYPYISNVTGTWAAVEAVVKPAYWVTHMRQTVRFADGIKTLIREKNLLLLEVGAGHDLRALVARYIEDQPDKHIINLVKAKEKKQTDTYNFLKNIGRMWLYGIEPQWTELYAGEERKRIPLPTYPFEKKKYWIEGDIAALQRIVAAPTHQLEKKPDKADWFYTPHWTRSTLKPVEKKEQTGPKNLLVFHENSPFTTRLIEQMKQDGYTVITVAIGKTFAAADGGENTYHIDPRQPEDYKRLFAELNRTHRNPAKIIHIWGLYDRDQEETADQWDENTQYRGYYSLLYMTQAIASRNFSGELQIDVVTDHMQEVTGNETINPQKATVLGPVKVIPQEYPYIRCRSIDVENPPPGTQREQQLIRQMSGEFEAEDKTNNIIAYRNY
ncbi:MAG: acyltransferase domain-containing protein, partial [bacterium]|nr:acyltransferase domain-containing protein [bacterium]